MGRSRFAYQFSNATMALFYIVFLIISFFDISKPMSFVPSIVASGAWLVLTVLNLPPRENMFRTILDKVLLWWSLFLFFVGVGLSLFLDHTTKGFVGEGVDGSYFDFSPKVFSSENLPQFSYLQYCVVVFTTVVALYVVGFYFSSTRRRGD